MDIFGIGSAELLVILLVAGIILGPERLLHIGREAGKFTRSAKGYLKSLSSELRSELDILEDLRDVKREVDQTVSDTGLDKLPRR